WRPTYFDNILSKTGALPVFDATSSVKRVLDLTRHLYFILFKKQKLTYNRFMKLTIEQTKELKTYLKDKTYSPF
ncbi:hypothetical protein, partial [Streptococcus suis]|uniref:hypothetical protein n=1 Tax=Streptococcus suis TaxID=1307 RepID=UPI001EDEDFEE